MAQDLPKTIVVSRTNLASIEFEKYLLHQSVMLMRTTGVKLKRGQGMKHENRDWMQVIATILNECQKRLPWGGVETKITVTLTKQTVTFKEEY